MPNRWVGIVRVCRNATLTRVSTPVECALRDIIKHHTRRPCLVDDRAGFDPPCCAARARHREVITRGVASGTSCQSYGLRKTDDLGAFYKLAEHVNAPVNHHERAQTASDFSLPGNNVKSRYWPAANQASRLRPCLGSLPPPRSPSRKSIRDSASPEAFLVTLSRLVARHSGTATRYWRSLACPQAEWDRLV